MAKNNKKNKKTFLLKKTAYLVFSISVLCFAVVSVSFASWNAPTQDPPEGNVPAPINTGDLGQYKQGWLTIGSNDAPRTTLDIEGTGLPDGTGVISSTSGAILNTAGATYGLLVPFGKVGIGTTSPGQLLSVGANNQFQVNSSGDIVKIKGTPYLWPSAQGAASTCLQNNGSGTLSWSACGNGGGTNYWTLSGSNLYPNQTSYNVGIGTTTPDNLLQVTDLIDFNNSKANTALGHWALHSNISGEENTANGVSALYSNTTGNNNTANGVSALGSNTTGYENTANGVSALGSNTTGIQNTANGVSALGSNTTGKFNTAIGNNADVLSGNLYNATAIGYNAKVGGSNMLVLGGTGSYAVNVGVGTTNPGYKLDVNGALRLEPSSAPTGANGVMYYDSTTGKFKCYENNAWTNCIGGSGTGYWTLSGTNLYPNPISSNVGIGTTNLDNTAKLTIAGNINISGEIDNKTDGPFFINSYGQLQLRMNNCASGTCSGTGNFQINNSANNTVFSITDSGNVGIGTTTPGTNKLEIVGGPTNTKGGLIIQLVTSQSNEDSMTKATGQLWLRTDINP